MLDSLLYLRIMLQFLLKVMNSITNYISACPRTCKNIIACPTNEYCYRMSSNLKKNILQPALILINNITTCPHTYN